jgi:hypothetical protein
MRSAHSRFSFRPALLAGLSRVITDPAVFQELQSATIFRGRKNFDRFYLEAKTGEAVQKRH